MKRHEKLIELIEATDEPLYIKIGAKKEIYRLLETGAIEVADYNEDESYADLIGTLFYWKDSPLVFIWEKLHHDFMVYEMELELQEG